MRTLGRAHMAFYSACHANDFAAHSRWYQAPPLRGCANPEPRELEIFLRALPLERAVLIPCADDWLQAVAALPNALAARFTSSTPAPATVRTMVDKWCFAQMLEEVGTPHPHTLLLTSHDQMQSMPEAAFDSWLLKPLLSREFARRHGVKGYLVKSREEALKIATSIQFPIMLQEYIPGPPSATCFVDGFVDRHGITRARFARRRLRVHPTTMGNSSLMVSIPLEEIGPAVESLDRLLASIAYRGTFSAEFKYDFRDRTFKILEINARPWWYVEFAARQGVDVCRLAYLDALGLPVESIESYAIGRRCVYLPVDFQAYRELRAARAISPLSWIRSLVGANDALFEWDDPGPALACAVHSLRTLLQGCLSSWACTDLRPKAPM